MNTNTEKFDPETSELELKYEISEDLFHNPDKITKKLGNLFGDPMKIMGTDRFFKLNGKFFRIRADKVMVPSNLSNEIAGSTTYCITIKERIKQDDLTVRKEIDLSCGSHERPFEFFQMLGAEEAFRLHKLYYVWLDQSRLSGPIKINKRPHLMVASYCVSSADGTNKRYFLEVEVEKTGNHSLSERLEHLKDFSKKLEEDLELKTPVNLSLFEIYCPKDAK